MGSLPYVRANPIGDATSNLNNQSGCHSLLRTKIAVGTTVADFSGGTTEQVKILSYGKWTEWNVWAVPQDIYHTQRSS